MFCPNGLSEGCFVGYVCPSEMHQLPITENRPLRSLKSGGGKLTVARAGDL